MYSVLKNNLTILKVKLYCTKYDDFYFNTIQVKGEVGGGREGYIASILLP